MRLIPKNGCDIVFTPPALCSKIVQHFQPNGSILEPCAGLGNFVKAINEYIEFSPEFWNKKCDYCEIEVETNVHYPPICKDFLQLEEQNQYNYVVTNFPYSKLTAMLSKSYKVTYNIISLQFINALFQKRRLRDMRDAGFGVVEILEVDTPSKEEGWSQAGLSLGCIHLRRGYNGDIKFGHLNNKVNK